MAINEMVGCLVHHDLLHPSYIAQNVIEYILLRLGVDAPIERMRHLAQVLGDSAPCPTMRFVYDESAIYFPVPGLLDIPPDALLTSTVDVLLYTYSPPLVRPLACHRCGPFDTNSVFHSIAYGGSISSSP